MALPRNLLIRASAEVVAKAASVVLVVAVARSVGREGFGEFSIAWAAGWLASAASDLGLHLVVVREVVRGEEGPRRIAAAAVVAKLALTVLALVGLAGAEPLLGVADRVAFWSIAGALVLLSYADLAQHLFRARGAFGRDAAAQVASRVGFLAGGLVGLWAGGVRGAALGMLAGAAVGLVAPAVAVWREYGGLDASRGIGRAARWLLGRSLPVGVGIALSMLYVRVDLFLLDAMTDSETVGLYAGAYRIFEAAQLLPAVSMAVLFPRLAATDRASDEGRALRRRAFAGLAAAGAIAALAGAALAPVVVETLYGAPFAAAAGPLAILFLATPVMFVNYLLTQDLVSGGGGRAYAVAAGIALAANVVVNLVAIPRLGMVGAAVATVVTEVVLLGVCMAAIHFTQRTAETQSTQRWAVALAAAALVSLPFESEQLAIAAGGLVVTLPEALVGASVVAATVGLWRARAGLDRTLGLVAGGFVVALLVATLLAPEHRGNALRFSLRMAAGAAFGIAVAGLVAERTRRATVLVAAYVAGVAAASCVGVAEIVAAERVEPFLTLFREGPSFSAGLRRVTATFGYPNTAAASIAVALPAAAVLAVVGRRPALRVAAAASIAVMAVALVATFSRGGLVAAACGLGVLSVAALARTETRRLAAGAAGAVAAIALAWAVASLGGAGLAERGLATGESELVAARIKPGVSSLAVDPGASGRMPVRITNTGRLAWRSASETPYVLVSRWYDAAGRELSPEGVRTALPAEVAPGATVEVDGAFVVPDAAGGATLVWDVYIEHRLRFSERGSRPGLVRVAIGPAGVPAPEGEVSLAGIYNAPPRTDLWRAALAMWRERPFVGFGPDAYRLTYGRFLGLAEWDHRVYANNLWLELLATTGVLGTGAFLALLGVVGRRVWQVVRAGDAMGLAAVAGLAVFLAHGLVDYFLACTVGYVPFWAFVGTIVGLARAEAQRRGGAE